MKWSETNIMFGLEDHPEIELSNQNLPFVVKLPIGRHKVAKTFIDNGASLTSSWGRHSSRWATI
jgi:hypothetical protein